MVQGPPPPAPRRPHRPSPRRRQAPCCCPSARQSPVGSKQGMPTGRRALAWLEAFLTQWPGHLSICEGPAAAFTARRPGLQPHSRAHPGLSRVVSLRHPEPALPRPPPQLGPRRSTEAAATTSQVHSPGGDSTSRELASGTGQLNTFIAFTCTEPPNFTCSPSGFKQALSVCPGGGGITKRGRQVLRNRRGQSSGGKVTRALRTRCGQALGRLGARALTLRSCPPSLRRSACGTRARPLGQRGGAACGWPGRLRPGLALASWGPRQTHSPAAPRRHRGAEGREAEPGARHRSAGPPSLPSGRRDRAARARRGSPVCPCSFCTTSFVWRFQMYTRLSSDPDTIHWRRKGGTTRESPGQSPPLRWPPRRAQDTSLRRRPEPRRLRPLPASTQKRATPRLLGLKCFPKGPLRFCSPTFLPNVTIYFQVTLYLDQASKTLKGRARWAGPGTRAPGGRPVWARHPGDKAALHVLP